MGPPLEFSWETLNTIVGGGSAIDVQRLHIHSVNEAEAFLEGYGFVWTQAAHRREIEALRTEAVAFIEEILLVDEDGLQIPPEVRQRTDVRHLMIWASEPVQSVRQRWCCAMLRVMHTIAHADSTLNRRFGTQIREQILERFNPHLSLAEEGWVLGRGKRAVPLVGFEVKDAKALHSVVVKLLHKVENVAADIFDRVGVRFVTRERFDALMVVNYLRANNVIMFANVKPSRSRNTLIDMGWLREEAAQLDEAVAQGLMTAQDRLDELRRLVRARPFPVSPPADYNAFSAVDYHAIQFTCRQQIRLRNALAAPGRGRDELRFFFPFEIQILDQESYALSRSGLAAHDVYKKRQLAAVKRRVLGSLLPL